VLGRGDQSERASSAKSDPARWLAIVPCYNEGASIKDTLADLQKHVAGIRIVVIDDGSLDDTAARAAEVPGVRVVRLPANLGIGGAVATGLRYFLRHPELEVALQFDGDGQHRADQIRRLVEPIAHGDVDVVAGSRFLVPEQGTFQSSLARRAGIHLLSGWVWMLTGQTVTDVTSGFRAFSRKAAEALVDGYPDDYPEPLIPILLRERGLSMQEVPTPMKPRQGGSSSISGLTPVSYMAKVMIGSALFRLR